MVYTFASWCKPCRYKLPSVLQLAKDYDLELFILLIDEENSTAEASAIKYIEQVNEIHNASLKTYILKDENGVSAIKYRKVENEVVKIKYRKFLKRIAFEKFELTEELSKYILIDKSGEVLMVTSWKDRVGKKWKNNTSVIDNKILPLLE